MYEFVYTPYPDPKAALEDLREKLKKIDVDASFGIIFLTGDLIKRHKEFSGLLDCESVCVPIEGYVTHDAVWSRGAILVLFDFEVGIERYTGPASRVQGLLERSKKSKFSMLVYPSFYFGGRLSFLNALITEKRLYRRYKNGDLDALRRASTFLEDKFIYPINKMLRPFRDREELALSINIFPLEVKFGSPLISANGRELKRGVLRLRFGKHVKLDYSDTFPSRGNSVSETLEILKAEFGHKSVTEVKIEKRGIAIGHVDGLKVSEYVSKVRGLISSDTAIVDEGFLGASPYALWFVSSETYGSADVGILDFPLGIYPCLYDLDVFEDIALFSTAETIKGGLKILYNYLKENSDFDIAVIDENYILMYEAYLSKLCECFEIDQLGIFTQSAVAFSKTPSVKYMTEIEKKICLNLTRNISFLKF